MSIQLLNEDSYAFMAENYGTGHFDHIICDPPYDQYLPIETLKRICKGNIICFCAPENQYFKADEYAFWCKMPSTKNNSNSLCRFVEVILILRRPTIETSVFNKRFWQQMSNWRTDLIVEKQVHPYEKPLSLMEWLIKTYTNPGDHVFDPFAGTASCGVACQQLGRNYTGIEKEYQWYNIGKEKLRL